MPLKALLLEVAKARIVKAFDVWKVADKLTNIYVLLCLGIQITFSILSHSRLHHMTVTAQ